MGISLTKLNDTTFQVTSPDLPAPLALSSEAAIQLAEALVGNLDPGFKSDRMVWAPQSREPLGLWVKEDSQVELWLAGVNHPLTHDEARALGIQVLMTTARFQVGDEVQTTEDLGSEDGTVKAPSGIVGKIACVYWDQGDIKYTLVYDGVSYTNNLDKWLKTPDPVFTYEVVQEANFPATRTALVQARSPDEARKEAATAFKNQGQTRGWTIDRRSPDILTDPDVRVVSSEHEADLNAQDGFVVSSEHGIQAYRDADNNSIFEGNDTEALAYVVAQAERGSSRHQRALRKALGV